MKTFNFIVLAVTVASPAVGRYGETQGAIVGGALATEADILATVALVDASTGAQSCTGTLVAPHVVVTAAHCFIVQAEEGGESRLQPASGTQVVFGVLDTNDAGGDGRVAIRTVVTHPDYEKGGEPVDESGLGSDHDIAFLILESDITTLTPVPILMPADYAVGLSVSMPIIITGYGTIEDGGQDSGVLYTATTEYVKRTDNEFLAGGAGLPDTCPGDSGGPAYVDLDGALFLAGATSRGRQDAETGCGDGGVYTLVGAYYDWINTELTANGAPTLEGGASDGVDAADGADGADAEDGLDAGDAADAEAGGDAEDGGNAEDGGDRTNTDDEEAVGCSAARSGSNAPWLMLLLALAWLVVPRHRDSD